jgi:hypothetical protein
MTVPIHHCGRAHGTAAPPPRPWLALGLLSPAQLMLLAPRNKAAAGLSAPLRGPDQGSMLLAPGTDA